MSDDAQLYQDGVEHGGRQNETEREQRMPAPLGGVSHLLTREQAEKKFFSLICPVYGEERAIRIRDMVDHIEHHSVPELLALLARLESFLVRWFGRTRMRIA